MHLNVRTCVTIGVVVTGALLIGDGGGDGVKHGAGVQDGECSDLSTSAVSSSNSHW